MNLKSAPLLIFLLFISLRTPPAHACAEVPPPSSWFFFQLALETTEPVTGVELNVVPSSFESEEDNLQLTNNTDAPVYVVYDPLLKEDVRAGYDEYLASPDEFVWTEEIQSLLYPIAPNESQVIYDRWRQQQTDIVSYPSDLGGQRPADITIPAPQIGELLLVHQDGVQTISFTETYVLNPDYPPKAWLDCVEEEVYYRPPTPENSAPSPTSNTTSPLWALIGGVLLTIIAVIINKWK